MRFDSSPNLKAWTQLGDFGPAGDIAGEWECPDMLQIPSSDGKESIWALKVGFNPGAPQGGSGEQYFLGNFDGKSFTSPSEPGSHGWTNYGKDDYCAISFNGLPKGQRPVLLGWMNNWQYAAKNTDCALARADELASPTLFRQRPGRSCAGAGTRHSTASREEL